MEREDVRFRSADADCAAWVYRPEPSRKAAERAPRGELLESPGGHFDIYVGEPFERAIADQLAFLERVP